MLEIILSYFKDIKNIIITILLVVIGGLFINRVILKHEISSLNSNIEKLTNEKAQLSLAIDKQNLAIKQLNDEQKAREDEFNKKYQELQDTQKPITTYIDKQKQYTSPLDKTEKDATKAVVSDFIKNKGVW